MTVRFQNFSVEASDGAVIGIVGDQITPLPGQGRHLGPQASLDFTPVKLLVIHHSLAYADALARAQAAISLNRLRANGSTILLYSHEPALLRELSDEIWWMDKGVVAAKGDPRQVLTAYQESVAVKMRAWGETQKPVLAAAMRKGDGRAEIVALETIGSNGKSTMVLQSGELAIVRVVVCFREAVANPVIGIMIRTRIGLEVYGTNTQLENVAIGPRRAGDTVRVEFGFRCELCPKGYTLTAASHDPDGTAHDWMDDAVAFTVADSRYTAGVANLHATASWYSVE